MNSSLAKLKKAEGILNNQFLNEMNEHSAPDKFAYSKLLSVTFNNFACVYKRLSKPEVALEYL